MVHPCLLLGATVAALLAAVVPTAVRAQQTGVVIRPENLTLAPGGSALVRIEATAPAGGLGAWGVDVQFDPSVVRATACASQVPGGLSICNKDFAPNAVRVAGASATGVTGTPVLGEITFTAVGPPGSSSALTPVLAAWAGPQGDALPAEAMAGRVRIAGEPAADPPSPAPIPAPAIPPSGPPNDVAQAPAPALTADPTPSAAPDTAGSPPSEPSPSLLARIAEFLQTLWRQFLAWFGG